MLLSGEGTTLSGAEARALFLAADPSSKFVTPEPRVILADSEADPFQVGSRVAFARRVGLLFDDADSARDFVGRRSVRLRAFDLVPGLSPLDPGAYLQGIDLDVDLDSPQLELTLLRGKGEYLAVTDPMSMRQGWSTRRPRRRAYFHPSAVFPKLARALVNLTRCGAGDLFLDPFSGTGSLAIEAQLIGSRVVALDRDPRMASGSLANMKFFRQSWLGVVRANSFFPPLKMVDAIATDIPYGRASSTGGKVHADVLAESLRAFPVILSRGGRLVVMHPQQDKAESSSSLELEEEHDLYVHKLLTRTISILRKK